MKKILSNLQYFYSKKQEQSKIAEDESKVEAAIYALACCNSDFFNADQLNNIQQLGLPLPTIRITKQFDPKLVIPSSEKLCSRPEMVIINKMDFSRRWALQEKSSDDLTIDCEYQAYLSDTKCLMQYIKEAFSNEAPANNVLNRLNIKAEPKEVVKLSEEAANKIGRISQTLERRISTEINNDVSNILAKSSYATYTACGAIVGAAVGGPFGAAVGALIGIVLAFSINYLTDLGKYELPAAIKRHSLFSPAKASNLLNHEKPVTDVLQDVTKKMEKRI